MRFLRIAAAALVIVSAFALVFAVLEIGSRQYASIWLPFALAGFVGCLLTLAPATYARKLIWAGISCGALLIWMLSEPEVSFHSTPSLRPLAAILGAACLLAFGSLFAGSVSGTNEERKRFRWTICLLIMSWLIAYFSSPSGGSGGMISLAMRWFHLNAASAETLVLVVRKTIHFSFYGLLGWTGFRWALSMDLALRRAIVLGLGLVLIHASFDEGRQTLFANRTGSAYDVLLDLTGASVFVGFSAARRRNS